MLKGKLIVFEGIDGSGKSSQIASLSHYFTIKNIPHTTSQEPTTGFWGYQVRQAALTERLAPEIELEYLLKDRREHVEQLILPNLEKGITVLLDRYYFSNIAYQGSAGISIHHIRQLNEAFAPRPDLMFLFDLTPEQALARIKIRNEGTNAFEKKAGLQKCRELFLNFRNEPFVRVMNAMEDKKIIHQFITKACDDLFEYS